MNRAYKKHTTNIILHCERLSGLPTKTEHSREMCFHSIVHHNVRYMAEKKRNQSIYSKRKSVCVCIKQVNHKRMTSRKISCRTNEWVLTVRQTWTFLEIALERSLENLGITNSLVLLLIKVMLHKRTFCYGS